MTGGSPVKAELGPMTRTVEDLILSHQYLYNPENYLSIPPEMRDPYIYYKPLNEKIVYGNDPLKVGIVHRLMTSRCTPPIDRALREASDKLV